jgi:type VI secretion system FHA domain protein
LTLTLEVIASGGDESDGTQGSFGLEGGTIGRHPDSTLVLSDGKVSSQHALVSCTDGVFYIEDTSRNGTSVNTPANRLVQRQPYPLETGDVILIGPYQIRVHVARSDRARDVPYQSPLAPSPRERAAVQPSPFDFDDPFAPAASPPVEMPELEQVGQEASRAELDPLRNLFPEEGSPAERAAKPKVVRAQDLDRGLPFDAHYRPPSPVADGPVAAPPPRPGPAEIPAGYNPLEDQSLVAPSPAPDAGPPPPEASIVRPRPSRPAVSAPPPEPDVAPAAPVERDRPERIPPSPPQAVPAALAPIAPPPVPASGVGDLGAVLAGAGLDPSLATDELGRQLGAILRVVVSGVMDVMESRAAIKDDLDLRRTRFKPAENNPLKFSANVDDALHNLLVKRNPAYLPPVAAFERAFDDLRHHQVAVLAGIQAGFDAVLAAFDADRLQEQFDREAGGGLIPAKLRYWDLYRERMQGLLKDPETTYRELFAKAFAKGYAERLERLKAAPGRDAAPPDPGRSGA